MSYKIGILITINHYYYNIIIINNHLHSLIFCCCNLKDRGPGRKLTSRIESSGEVGDKLGNEHSTGKSFPTEISVSLSESESESETESESLFWSELKERKKIGHCYQMRINSSIIVVQDKYFRNFPHFVSLKNKHDAYLSSAELLPNLACVLCVLCVLCFALSSRKKNIYKITKFTNS